jgi:hydrogenase expression/formation protein HypC
MCLALPAKIVKRQGDDGWVLLGDAHLRVNLLMTPECQVGDWVLVHAGFSIQTVAEADALETWRIIEAVEAQAQESEP